MINKMFWAKVAEKWVVKEENEIPDIPPISPIDKDDFFDDFFKDGEIEDILAELDLDI